MNLKLFGLIVILGAGASFASMLPLIDVSVNGIGVFDTITDLTDPNCFCANPNFDPNLFDENDPNTHPSGPQFCETEIDADGNVVVIGDPNHICTWEVSPDYYGGAYDDEGCSAKFWLDDATSNSFISWNSHYPPDSKFNEIFLTDISIMSHPKIIYKKGNFDVPGRYFDNGAYYYQKALKHAIHSISEDVLQKIYSNEEPIKEVESILKQIDELNLNKASENKLTKYLEKILKILNDKKIQNDVRSCNEISHFIDQVIIQIDTGKISEENGTNLIDKARNVCHLVVEETRDTAQSHINKATLLLADFENNKDLKDALKEMKKGHLFKGKGHDKDKYEKDDFYVKDPTLLEVLKLYHSKHKSDLKTLAGESVAALLNSAHIDIKYKYSTSETIDMANKAITSEQYGTILTELRSNNLAGSPLCS